MEDAEIQKIVDGVLGGISKYFIAEIVTQARTELFRRRRCCDRFARAFPHANPDGTPEAFIEGVKVSICPFCGKTVE